MNNRQAFGVVLLVVLLVALASSADAYDRGDYPTWLDLDDDGLDTRDEALFQQSLIPPTVNAGEVVAGLWLDPYTGQVFRDPGELDVDHVLSLREIDAAGGAGMTTEQRARVANDLDNLLVVSASANRSKGSRNAAEWLPPNLAYCIEYLDRRRATRDRWGLARDPGERAAVAFWRIHCPRHEIGIKLGRVRAWLGTWRDLLFK